MNTVLALCPRTVSWSGGGGGRMEFIFHTSSSWLSSPLLRSPSSSRLNFNKVSNFNFNPIRWHLLLARMRIECVSVWVDDDYYDDGNVIRTEMRHRMVNEHFVVGLSHAAEGELKGE